MVAREGLGRVGDVGEEGAENVETDETTVNTPRKYGRNVERLTGWSPCFSWLA